ncbi:unnamed protein product [Lactuca saligna]|uniref:Uncharacterized protein n=1 Tax=Lactuca saligna TaxID=75948 RepID=A0AA35ZRA4_LACSI|nr:unnamed protein product [Lactuca saligna]
MRVVRNYVTHLGILNDNDDANEQPTDQPEPQQRPRRWNVRGRSARGQPMHPRAPIGGSHIGDDMTGYYHYPIYPRMSEYQDQGGDGAGTSGARDEEEDD